jgi:hypothetical protein
VTRLEREGGQQPAQPGARNLGDGAVVQPDLEWPEQPDVHELILPRATGEPAVSSGLRGLRRKEVRG